MHWLEWEKKDGTSSDDGSGRLGDRLVLLQMWEPDQKLTGMIVARPVPRSTVPHDSWVE